MSGAKAATKRKVRRHVASAPSDDFLLDSFQVARRLGGCISARRIPDYAGGWPALVEGYRPLRITGRRPQARWLLSAVVKHITVELAEGQELARAEAMKRWGGA